VAVYESNDASKEKGIAQDNLSLEIGKEYVLSAWVKILNGRDFHKFLEDMIKKYD